MDSASVGTFLLWGAALGCVATALAAMVRPGATRPLLAASAMLAIGACVVLAWALLAPDFSLAYVADTTSSATPWPYRLAALWGAMEGSLLFWSAMLLTVGVIALWNERLPNLAPAAAGVIAAVAGVFIAIGATMASPFAELAVPAVDGVGLLAILQHPAMVYHPPILYAGLTAVVVPFALTLSALAAGRLDREWLATTRRWALIAWLLVTSGMVLGANWAYIELGWGGFWAWDPVENTSLMPWLALTGFIHLSKSPVERRLRWIAGLALLPLVLMLSGVYLTRSGVTGSIHAFAESETIGRILLVFAVVVALAAVGMWFTLTRSMPAFSSSDHTRSRWLAVNALLLTVAAVFVTVGTVYPTFAKLVLGETVAVRAGYFVLTMTPVALIALPSMASVTPRIRPALMAVVAMAVLVIVGAAAGFGRPAPLLLAGTSLAMITVIGIDWTRRSLPLRRAAAHLGHAGLAVLILGVSGSALGADARAVIGPGESVDAGPYRLVVDAITTGETERYLYAAADIRVVEDGNQVTMMRPEIRVYESQLVPTPEPALRSSVGSDLIVAIARIADDGSWVDVNVFWRPLVAWVWVGAVMMVGAGVVALRARVGAGGWRRRAATEAPLPAETTTGTSTI